MKLIAFSLATLGCTLYSGRPETYKVGVLDTVHHEDEPEPGKETTAPADGAPADAEPQWKDDVKCDKKTAKDRAQWLLDKKKVDTEEAAHKQVMKEFPNEFGIPVTKWNDDVMLGGKPAKERAQWVKDNVKGATTETAQKTVMAEFPGIFTQWNDDVMLQCTADSAQPCTVQHAKERAQWLVDILKADDLDIAKQLVMKRFPKRFHTGATEWNDDIICDGKTAGERKKWLLDKKKADDEDAAKKQVMKEFPAIFGRLEPQVWNDDVKCDGKLAKDRAQWLVDNKKVDTKEAAHKQVMREFPDMFERKW